MSQATKGDTVKVHYTGRLPDGTIFDSSQGRDPLEFTLGQGQVIAGFEKAVDGMSPGESTTADIPATDAYGAPREYLRVEIDRQQLPADIEPEVGQRFELKRQDGESMEATVAEVSDEAITFDGNHPLAGKDLTFDIELVAIA